MCAHTCSGLHTHVLMFWVCIHIFPCSECIQTYPHILGVHTYVLMFWVCIHTFPCSGCAHTYPHILGIHTRVLKFWVCLQMFPCSRCAHKLSCSGCVYTHSHVLGMCTHVLMCWVCIYKFPCSGCVCLSWYHFTVLLQIGTVKKTCKEKEDSRLRVAWIITARCLDLGVWACGWQVPTAPETDPAALAPSHKHPHAHWVTRLCFFSLEHSCYVKGSKTWTLRLQMSPCVQEGKLGRIWILGLGVPSVPSVPSHTPSQHWCYLEGDESCVRYGPCSQNSTTSLGRKKQAIQTAQEQRKRVWSWPNGAQRIGCGPGAVLHLCLSRF